MVSALEQLEDVVSKLLTFRPLLLYLGRPLVVSLSECLSEWPRLLQHLLEEIEIRVRRHCSHLTDAFQVAVLDVYRALWSHQRLDSLGSGLQVISTIISNFSTDRKKPAAASLGNASVDVLLLPLSILSSSQNSTATLRSTYIAGLVGRILPIPQLPSRLSVLQLAKVAAKFPLDEVAAQICLQSARNNLQAATTTHVLASFLVLANQRVPKLADGKALIRYLEALTLLQNLISPAALASTDPDTQKRLAILPSSKHLSAILGVAAKFPSSTRPALYSFLCSVLFSWPEETRTQVLHSVLYGSVSSASSGFVRELWRGYVRSTPLTKALSSANSTSTGVFARPSLEGWPALVLLSELYSRQLLTLGDDEFFPSQGSNVHGARGQDVASSSSAAVVAARNPLSIDEVLSFTAIVRNLAFSLYWDLDNGTTTSPGSGSLVPNLRLTWLNLRDSSTRLLQQIHARDARHPFTPADYWLMTGDLDLNSFIESVLSEEDKLAQDDEEAEAAANLAATAAGEVNVDEDGDQEMDEVMPGIAHRTTKRHLSARKLAFISPRLGILNNLPFVIPFDKRIEIFRAFVYRDANRSGIMNHYGRRRKRVTIRRDHVSDDGMAQLNGLGSALKDSLEIVFIDQWGMEEAGIDGGGVFKEFLTSLTREVFDTDRGLWQATDQQELFPNPQSYARESDQLAWYAFLGRVLGKALYEGILVDVRFASFFLSKWLGRKGMSHLDDLASLNSLDSELYRGLIYLKNYVGDVEADLSLNFTVSDEEFGVQRVTELIPNGANIAVTNKNRLSYIFHVANYRLEAQIRLQCSAFFSGLSELIDPRWLRIFDQIELQKLIKGSDSPIDLEDLRANTILSDYHEKDLTITYFWQALESFDQETRSQFLKFVTSCPSPPLLGFSQLNPKFCIRLSSEDQQRLPTSSTCINLLKLPRYESFELTRRKILIAIQSGAGFDLS